MSMSAARRHRRASRRHRARVMAVVASWMFDGFSRRQARILERTMRLLIYPPTMPTDPRHHMRIAELERFALTGVR